jgi:hypothetical protein
MMFDLILKQLASPSTGKMLGGKLKELFSFLATEFKCDVKDIGLFLKLEQIPENGKDGKPTGKMVEEAIIYIYANNQAVQKITVAEFLALATKGGK